MQKSLNKVLLIGDVARDITVKNGLNGKQIVRFSLATSRKWVTQAGEEKSKTEFHHIVAFNDIASKLARMVHKYDTLFLEGVIETNEIKKDDGSVNSLTEIFCQNFTLLECKHE